MKERQFPRLGNIFLEIVLLFIFGSLILNVICSSALLLSFLIYLILLIYIFVIHGKSLKSYYEKNHLRHLRLMDIIWIITFVIITRMIGLYFDAISEIFFENHVSQSLQMSSGHMLLAVVAIALLPALVEESVYRGYVFQRLGNGKKTVLISAFMFAIWHMNFNQMTYAFAIGILFALIFRYTDNLLITMLVHMLFNFITVMENVYSDLAWVQEAESFQIGGYQLFCPVFTDEMGKLCIGSILVGTLITALIILIFAGILYGIGKTRNVPSWEGDRTKHEFGISFVLCTSICILMAVLTEVLV